MFDLIIIGSGPAGITAGIYAARKKINTLILTKDFIGQVGRAFLIENYPGFTSIRGMALVEQWKKQLEAQEIETREGETVKAIRKKENFFEVETNNQTYTASSIIIATGRAPRKLNILGEREFLGKGLGYCVTCDGPLFRDKIVAVIGGGNSGFGAALELSEYCAKIYLLHSNASPNADEISQDKVNSNKKIELILNASIKEVRGNNTVKSLVYEDVLEKQKKELKVEGIFIEIGYIPATDFLKDVIDLNDHHEIIINSIDFSTSVSGIFAAGDVVNGSVKQIITAAGDGCKAAISAYEYIKKR